jgi:hypothetical protein
MSTTISPRFSGFPISGGGELDFESLLNRDDETDMSETAPAIHISG